VSTLQSSSLAVLIHGEHPWASSKALEASLLIFPGQFKRTVILRILPFIHYFLFLRLSLLMKTIPWLFIWPDGQVNTSSQKSAQRPCKSFEDAMLLLSVA
jgi:hypothetical protein